MKSVWKKEEATIKRLLASDNTPRWLDFWVRVNNIDVSNSNIRAVVPHPQEKTVVTLNVVLPLNSGDTEYYDVYRNYGRRFRG